jgi:hypothetical protein
MGSKWERWSTLSGALAVPFWVAGIILISTQATGSKGPKILAAYRDNHNAILLGGLLWSLGVVLFVWFLGSLRTHYLEAEGAGNGNGTADHGRIASLAFGGGISAATLAMLIPALDEAGALDYKDIDASGASVLHHATDAFFIATEYTLAILFFASAIAALRHGALPKWLGWLSALIGVVLLIGPIGWAAFIFATPIWTLIVSFTLWRRAERAAQTTTEPALSVAG